MLLPFGSGDPFLPRPRHRDLVGGGWVIQQSAAVATPINQSYPMGTSFSFLSSSSPCWPPRDGHPYSLHVSPSREIPHRPTFCMSGRSRPPSPPPPFTGGPWCSEAVPSIAFRARLPSSPRLDCAGNVSIPVVTWRGSPSGRPPRRHVRPRAAPLAGRNVGQRLSGDGRSHLTRHCVWRGELHQSEVER